MGTTPTYNPKTVGTFSKQDEKRVEEKKRRPDSHRAVSWCELWRQPNGCWDSDNDGEFLLNVRNISSSAVLANAMVDVDTRYGIGLSPRIVNPGSGSDNLPFWFFGFGAIGVEELYGEDWNDYSHDAGDRLSQFSPQYFQNCARFLSGTLASLTGLQ